MHVGARRAHLPLLEMLQNQDLGDLDPNKQEAGGQSSLDCLRSRIEVEEMNQELARRHIETFGAVIVSLEYVDAREKLEDLMMC